jgi:RimJ/RimL family protein N-acetyltransferase
MSHEANTRPAKTQAEGTIETDRLILRPWSEQDANSLFRYASDRTIERMCGFKEPHRTVRDSLRAIREVLMADESYAITIKGHMPKGEAVGAIALKPGPDADFDMATNEGEIGYWIGRPFWGQGYVPEAAQALIRHAFVDLGYSGIWAGCFEGNEQSERVMEKLGMRHHHDVEHSRKAAESVLGEDRALHVSLLTRAQWEAAEKGDPVEPSYIERQQAEAADLERHVPLVSFVRSGGQTGADRGALDAARSAGVPICGWCPPGGLAEDQAKAPGVMSLYPELEEAPTEGYVGRTALNVRDSHATLVVAPGGLEPKSGTEMTVRFARDYGRPFLVVEGPEDLEEVERWLVRVGKGLTLNVAGPRESKLPGIHDITEDIVAGLLAWDRRRR